MLLDKNQEEAFYFFLGGGAGVCLEDSSLLGVCLGEVWDAVKNLALSPNIGPLLPDPKRQSPSYLMEMLCFVLGGGRAVCKHQPDDAG